MEMIVSIRDMSIEQISSLTTLGVFACVPTGKLAKRAIVFKNEIELARYFKTSNRSMVLLVGSNDTALWLSNYLTQQNIASGSVTIIPVPASDNALV